MSFTDNFEKSKGLFPCMTRYTAFQIKDMMENAGFSYVSFTEKGSLFCVKGSTK